MTGSATDAPEVLRAEGLRKAYGATVALAGIDFSCAAGEVHALIGENGSGKSTFVKILSGVTRPGGGRIELDGSVLSATTPAAAMRAGISTVFQELSLVKGLTVAENLLLAREPLAPVGVISRRELYARAKETLDEWEATELPANVDVGVLSLAQQQRLEIVRALSRRVKLLLLDEPTSALGPTDVDWLKRQLPRLRAKGVAVIFISHRLGEVKELADRMSVLRNGESVGTFAIGEVTDAEIIERMIGRSLADEFSKAAISTSERKAAQPVLETRGLRLSSQAEPIDLRVQPGEILGVAGLEGQGQKLFFNVLYGAERPHVGTISIDSTPLETGSTLAAVAAGLGYVPEERRDEGLFLELPVKANLSITCLRRFSRLGFLKRRAEAAAARTALRQLNVAEDRLMSDVGELSGGNQQKIVLAKWLLRGCKVLLLFDPTRGVDVGAKSEIFELMRTFAANGGGIVFYSSDLDELSTIPDSVAVFYRNSVVERVAREELSQPELMRAMLGISEEGVHA